jgi:glycosyltransferase involved in cell wall biosynthesis
VTVLHDTVVDVGIPTRGQPAYLAEAIECVLGQTFQAWRLTISENGEGNEFVARIVEPYLHDLRVSHVLVGEDVGGAGNASLLVRAARARYVGILHDDDRWAPRFLERRVRFLESHPSCGLVFSSCDFIDPSGGVLYRVEPDLAPGLQDRAGFLRELYRFNMICTPAVLVPRACYEVVGPAYDASVLFHDYEMWLRLATRFDVGFLPECDTGYRVHASQTSQDVRRHWGEHRIAVLDAAERVLPPDFSSLERRRVRFAAHARAVADAAARREPGSALASLGRSLREHPLAPIDPATFAGAVSWISRRGLRRRVRRALTRPHPGGGARAGRASSRSST